ncbi:gliding motility-associated C-terminal domain-containing protein [Saprospiraceae bacterium]|nr:gliding motility-associated C-terminal domain-containing protein [Saprospiraceae bacterium]
MHNNIAGKAAFSNRLLSLLRPAKPNPIYERTNYFMRILFLLTSYFIFSSIGILSAQDCDFPEITNGCECDSPIVVCNSEIDGFTGTLPASECGQQPATFCDGSGSVENPIWFSFVALSNTVEFIITPSGCSEGMGGFIGMQAAVYESCDDNNSFICEGTGTQDPIEIMADDFVIGNTYYLIVDGYGGSICDFEIDAIQGVEGSELTLGTEGPNVITGQTGSICAESGQSFTYEIPDCEVTGSTAFPFLYQNGYTCYEWTITPSTFSIVGGVDDGLSIELIFEEKDTYTISVERFIDPQIAECANGSCDDPEPVEISFCPIDTVTIATFLCPGEFKEICGNLISAPGIFECFDEASCTITFDTITVGGNNVENLGNIFLCPGECFTLEGEVYCDRIDYNLASTEDCSKSYIFSIKDLSITVTPDPYPVVNCNEVDEIVSHTVTTNYNGDLQFNYLDSDGMSISNDNFVLINTPGDYQFIVFAPGFENSCADTINFTIDIDDAEVDFSLQAGSLSCSDQQALVEVISADVIDSYSWSGPDISGPTNGSSIMVTDTGTYVVQVQGENGCTTEQTIIVEGNYPTIDVQVNYEELDCKIAQTTLSYISSLNLDSVLWAGPNEFKGTSEEVIAIDTGVYVLNLFASNGCDYSHIFKVLGNYSNPEFTSVVPEEWACESEMLAVTVDVEANSDYNFEWSSDGGILLGDITDKNTIVGSTGTYFVEIIDNVTGCSSFDTVMVIANEDVPTDLEIESFSPVCFDINDGMIDVQDVYGGVEPFEYILDGITQGSNLFENLAPADYEVSIIDANGCEVKRMVTISQPTQLIAEIAGPSEANFGDNVTIESVVDKILFDIDVINWYDEEGVFLGMGDDFQFIIEKNTIITMEVVDSEGCIVIRTIPVLLDEDYDYFLPNVFSPNDDGFNDNFAIFTQDLPGTIKVFAVYDRWGNQMFEAKNIENGVQDPSWGWDGRFNGKAVNAGVYVFYAEVETLGVEKLLRGSVTLIR